MLLSKLGPNEGKQDELNKTMENMITSFSIPFPPLPSPPPLCEPNRVASKEENGKEKNLALTSWHRVVWIAASSHFQNDPSCYLIVILRKYNITIFFKSFRNGWSHMQLFVTWEISLIRPIIVNGVSLQIFQMRRYDTNVPLI